MKHTLVLLVMVLSFGTGVYAFSNNSTSGRNYSKILHLLPDRVTPANVKSILGDAALIKIDNTVNDEQWEYRTADATMIFHWRNGELQNLNCTGFASSKSEWANKNLSGLEMGVSDVFDAMKTLGEPRDVFVNGSQQLLRYVYRENILELRFRDGLLSLCQVLYTGSSKKK